MSGQEPKIKYIQLTKDENLSDENNIAFNFNGSVDDEEELLNFVDIGAVYFMQFYCEKTGMTIREYLKRFEDFSLSKSVPDLA